MALDGLIGASAPPKVHHPGYRPDVDGQPYDMLATDIQAHSLSAHPVYELIYWDGRLSVDATGEIFPALRKVRACEGQQGCRVVQTPEVDEYGTVRTVERLDYSGLLTHMQADPRRGGKGWIRVDHLIGPMPSGDAGWADRAIYRAHCARVLDPEVLADILAEGARIEEGGLPSERPVNLQDLAGAYKPGTWQQKTYAAVLQGHPQRARECRKIFAEAQQILEQRRSGGKVERIDERDAEIAALRAEIAAMQEAKAGAAGATTSSADPEWHDIARRVRYEKSLDDAGRAALLKSQPVTALRELARGIGVDPAGLAKDALVGAILIEIQKH